MVTGCLAERYRDELQARDSRNRRGARHRRGRVNRRRARVGAGSAARRQPARPDDLSTARRRRRRTSRPRHRARRSVAGRELPTYLYDADTPRVLATPRHYAYVKIAEGCDYNCAFCIIPKLRGQYRSRPVDSIVARGARARRARRQGTAADLAGHDLLRHRPRRARRAGPPAARAERGRRPRVDPPALPLPDDDHRRDDRGDGRLRQGRASTSTCRCSTPPTACSSGCAGPAPAPATSGCSSNIRSALPDVTLRTTFIVGFPGETEADFDELVRLRPDGRVRPRRRLHLLARGRHRGRGLDDDVPAADEAAAAAPADGAAAEDRGPAPAGAGSASGCGCWSTARRPSTSWCCDGRLAGQAPEIDPSST